MTAFELVSSTPWAITPDFLRAIVEISTRQDVTPESVRARLGRPMENARKVSIRGDTAIVPVTGPIFPRAGLFTEISGATSINTLATDLQAALDNPAIRSVVLEIDSPGGQITGVAEFASMVRNASKPVHAYIDGSGCSAAYQIASAARSITVSSTAMVGSIGTVATVAKPDKNSRTVDIVSSVSPYKRVDIETESGRSKIQATVDTFGDLFVKSVAEYRGVTVEKVLADFGQGDVLIGQSAVDAGMADHVGTFESLLASLSGRPAMARSTSISMKGQAMPPETTATEPTRPAAEAQAGPTISAEQFADMQRQLTQLTEQNNVLAAEKFQANLQGIAASTSKFVESQVKGGTLFPAVKGEAAALHAQMVLNDRRITGYAPQVAADGSVSIVETAASGPVAVAPLFEAFVAKIPKHGLFKEDLPKGVNVLSNDESKPAGDAAYEATRKAMERQKARKKA